MHELLSGDRGARGGGDGSGRVEGRGSRALSLDRIEVHLRLLGLLRLLWLRVRGGRLPLSLLLAGGLAGTLPDC